MENIKIILAIMMMLQISKALPISTSLADGQIKIEVTEIPLETPKDHQQEAAELPELLEQPLETPKDPQQEAAELPELLEGPQHLQPNQDHSQKSDGHLISQPLVDLSNLPLAGTTKMLSSLPDLEQMKRDQLFALAMAQFIQYTQTLARQSEYKFSAILHDLEELKDDTTSKFVETQTENIQHFLHQLQDYKLETSKFMLKTEDIYQEFQNLLSVLQPQSMGYIQMGQILQNHNLGNFEKELEDYIEKMKKLYNHEVDNITKDISVIGEDSEMQIMTFFQNLLSYNKPKQHIEAFSQLLKL